MGPLTRVAAVAALALTPPAHADPIDRWQPLIAQASARCAIPVAWIERVMRAESAGLTEQAGRPIRSRAGAMGLMQLMPATWATMRARLALGADPDDPGDNILAGACYLRMMYDRFGHPALFAAYNAGPGRYARHLATGRSLPAETVAYLAKVSGQASGPSNSRAPTDTLFAVRSGSANPPAKSPPEGFLSVFAVRRQGF